MVFWGVRRRCMGWRCVIDEVKMARGWLERQPIASGLKRASQTFCIHVLNALCVLSFNDG